MLPPPCHGGMASSRSPLPNTTPMPVGAKILCPEKTKKSQSSACTSTRMWETACAPSTSTRRAVAMRHLDHLPRRRDGAERVRDLRERDEPRARAEQLLVLVEHDLAVVVHRRDAQPGALLGAELLPRHDVGVMLEPGDDDLVVLADVAAPPRLRDQVDALGRAADEDDLVAGRGVQKRAHLVSRALRRRRSRARPACGRRGECSSSRARRSTRADR